MSLYDWIKATPSYIHSQKMDEVLKYLRENAGITFFHFARRFNDGRYFELTTDRAWGLEYVTKYAKHDTFATNKEFGQDIWTWGDGICGKMEREMHEVRTIHFKIPPGVSFIQKYNDYCDSYSYSSNIFEQDRTHTLIKTRAYNLTDFEKIFLNGIKELLPHYNEKKIITINEKNDSINQAVLTKREYDILHFMKLGFTVCEVSKLLAITEGTIKNLIGHLKEKFNCRTREQLFALEVVKKLSSKDNR